VKVEDAFLVEEGPGVYLINCISPVFLVLTGIGKMTMQKLFMARVVHDTNELSKRSLISLTNVA
jgi:hypothetical protein